MQQVDPNVTERMRRDWNERAREDAHFYVAFGRRDQDPEEFFATASEVVQALDSELRRLPASSNRRTWRALEIGCGPGRLLRPMSRRFGEIHGIDVSDEMIRRAAANLSDIPHAHVHHTSGADLAPFADESFDFVYSYAVFQHIPDRSVVLQYMDEACRVLKPGGILRVQINGLDASAKSYDTWSGVRIPAQEVQDFARGHSMQLLALEGARTQYMWTTMRKPSTGISAVSGGKTRIRRITNAHSSEPVTPPYGRFASITLWIENLPASSDLNSLRVVIDDLEGTACYIGPPDTADGLQQLNVILPRLRRTGLVPLELFHAGERLTEPGTLRVIPPGPQVPIMMSVTDGINMLSGTRIVTGTVKVTVEQVEQPELFHASIAGRAVRDIDIFCADPQAPRYEINFLVPDDLAPGTHVLEAAIGRRKLGAVPLEIVPNQATGTAQ